jgi:hypothetical protein
LGLPWADTALDQKVCSLQLKYGLWNNRLRGLRHNEAGAEKNKLDASVCR